MDYSKEVQELMDYLRKTNSTWMPLSNMPDADFEKDIKAGVVVKKAYGREEYVTLKYFSDVEIKAAKRFFALSLKKQEVDEDKIATLIETFEKEKSEKEGFKFSFNEEQKAAVFMVAKNFTGIITGGPGTGKTSVLECIVYVLRELHGKSYRMVFTAPTGKASIRLSEAIHHRTETCHSYCGFGQTSVPGKAPDALFIDEASMADEELLNYIVSVVYGNAAIFLIGDPDQLVSVGNGNVLKDLINTNIVPVTQLTKTYRQDNSSKLFENIQIIREGANIPLKDGEDFENIRTEKNIVETTISKYLEAIKQFGPEETVILTAFKRKTDLCSNRINEKIQNLVNPANESVSSCSVFDQKEKMKKTFRNGDPVIQLINDKKTMICNGEVGKIVSIENDCVTVKFPQRTISYPNWKMKDFDLAYAISVHKSQGSQYKCVIFPFSRMNTNLDRSLVYTGVSRAKKKAILIGEDKVLHEACQKKETAERITFLREEIDLLEEMLINTEHYE